MYVFMYFLYMNYIKSLNLLQVHVIIKFIYTVVPRVWPLVVYLVDCEVLLGVPLHVKWRELGRWN